MCHSLIKQFCVVTIILSVITYTFSCIGYILSLIGSILVTLTLAWKLSIFIRRRRSNKTFISSYKNAVLITGCDSGFGNLLAHRLNREGFVVYATVLDRESDGSKQLTTHTLFPNKIKLIKMDVTNEEEVSKAYEFVSQDLKTEGNQLCGLVNMAGTLVLSPIDWGTIDSYRNVFDVNTYGMVRVTRTFLPLIRQSKGRIVNMASSAGRYTLALSAHYAMSKHAVVSFSDALRREMKNWDVSVCTVSPCTFKTRLTSPENLSRIWDNEWQNTANDVRKVYGQKYYESVRHSFNAIRTGNASHNLELVVDALMDALRSDCPQHIYNVYGTFKWRFIMFINDYLPVEWMDTGYA